MSPRRWVIPLTLFGGFAALGLLLMLTDAWADRTFFVRMPISTGLILCGAFTALLSMGWLELRRQRKLGREEAMTLAQDERRQFLRRLDHELKNPLTAARIHLASFESGSGSAEALRSQIDRMSHLVTDLRKLSDIEDRPLDRTPVNVEQLLTDVFGLIQEQTADQPREWAISIPKAPWPVPSISADYDLLFLALFNLLENAVKYSEPGDRIELRATEDGRAISIEVADTGPGVDPADRDHLFEELYRGKDALRTSGSGLGLTLVQAIIKRHAGTLQFRSRTGEGTVFEVSIPFT